MIVLSSIHTSVDYILNFIDFTFQVRARGEGFETYIEGLFGKNGSLNKNKLVEKFNKYRFFRSADEANEIRDKIDDIDYKNNALKHRYPIAEIGLKVFGNEIAFWSAEGDEEIKKSLERLDPKLRILEILSGKVRFYYFYYMVYSRKA